MSRVMAFASEGEAAMRFSHSGKIGDCIWAIPTMIGMAANCGQERFGIDLTKKYPFFTWQPETILPLFEAQPWYNADALGDPICVDHWWLTSFREGRLTGDWNIPRECLKGFGQPSTLAEKPWIFAEPSFVADYVISCNLDPGCRNPTMPWPRLMEQFGKDSVFVGLPEEHAAFEVEYGKVGYYPTRNFLEVAQVIAGARGFMGRQSANHAIAEAMKQTIVLEVAPGHPSVIFSRPGVRNII